MNNKMTKVLAVSDQVVERIYSLATSGHFRDIDLILGCGDLPYTTWNTLLSILNIPLFYVPGNHDPVYNPSHSLSHAEGGSNLDLKTAFAKDFFLAGLGGSIRYRPDGVNQYTQNEAYLPRLSARLESPLHTNPLWTKAGYPDHAFAAVMPSTMRIPPPTGD
jgi:hypothetical protein